jgi:hypothetical protein
MPKHVKELPSTVKDMHKLVSSAKYEVVLIIDNHAPEHAYVRKGICYKNPFTGIVYCLERYCHRHTTDKGSTSYTSRIIWDIRVLSGSRLEGDLLSTAESCFDDWIKLCLST